MAVWKLLGLDPKKLAGAQESTPKSKAETETVRKIVSELEHLEPARARFIAAFAYLLSRVAHADQQVSPEETRAMEQIVMEHGHVPEAQAVLIVQIAKTQSVLFSGTENFLVSREFLSIANHDEKIWLLDCLYAVCGADGTISTVEDNEIRNVSIELKVSHNDYIAVRMRYRDQLAIFKK